MQPSSVVTAEAAEETKKQPICISRLLGEIQLFAELLPEVPLFLAMWVSCHAVGIPWR